MSEKSWQLETRRRKTKRLELYYAISALSFSAYAACVSSASSEDNGQGHTVKNGEIVGILWHHVSLSHPI